MTHAEEVALPTGPAFTLGIGISHGDDTSRTRFTPFRDRNGKLVLFRDQSLARQCADFTMESLASVLGLAAALATGNLFIAVELRVLDTDKQLLSSEKLAWCESFEAFRQLAVTGETPELSLRYVRDVLESLESQTLEHLTHDTAALAELTPEQRKELMSVARQRSKSWGVGAIHPGTNSLQLFVDDQRRGVLFRDPEIAAVAATYIHEGLLRDIASLGINLSQMPRPLQPTMVIYGFPDESKVPAGCIYLDSAEEFRELEARLQADRTARLAELKARTEAIFRAKQGYGWQPSAN